MKSPFPSLLLILVVGACSDGASPKDVADAQGAPNKDAASAPGDSGKPEPQPAELIPNNTNAPAPDYAKIAEAACAMAGGTCDMTAENEQSGKLDSVTCDPTTPQVACVRAPADCGSLGSATCCITANGKPSQRRATCDRGYPTCSQTNDAWLSSGDCTDRGTEIPLPTDDLPSRWPDAVSVLEATRWACKEAGGDTMPKGAICEGKRLPFAAKSGVEICCVSEPACPDAYLNTECCDASGKVEEKQCKDGRGYCNALFIELGSVREVNKGTCAPFEPVAP